MYDFLVFSINKILNRLGSAVVLLQGQALTVAGLATLISLLLGLISGEYADIRSLLLVGEPACQQLVYVVVGARDTDNFISI